MNAQASAPERDVVLTGLGVQSCAGAGVAALWEALRGGRSGIGFDERMAALGMRCRVSGRVPGVEAAFAADDTLEPRTKASFSRFAKLGYLAAREALVDAGLPGGPLRPPPWRGRGGVVIGSGIGAMGEIAAQLLHASSGERPPSPGHAVPRVMPSLLPSLLAQRLGAELGGATLSLACNSGLAALDGAARDLGDGRADWYLVGAVEDDDPYTWWSFDAMRALARTPPECDDPARESRPLGRRPRGFVPAGAAAFLLLETRRSAEQRGARPRAVLRACGHRIGGACVSSFDTRSYIDVLGGTLCRAGVAPTDIDVLIPHAHSTPADIDELASLDDRLDLLRNGVHVCTPKALLGHAIGASGLLDVVALAAQLEHSSRVAWPPHDELPERIARLAPLLAGGAPGAPFRIGLKTAHAFGGSVAAVVLEAQPS